MPEYLAVPHLPGVSASDPLRSAVSPALANPGQAESPFSFFLDQAVQALQDVSAQEQSANQSIQDYVHGEADLPDVVMQVAEAALMVQATVAIGTAMVNAWRELNQMQV